MENCYKAFPDQTMKAAEAEIFCRGVLDNSPFYDLDLRFGFSICKVSSRKSQVAIVAISCPSKRASLEQFGH